MSENEVVAENTADPEKQVEKQPEPTVQQQPSTPTQTENNVEKMLQVFQQLASQQGNSQQGEGKLLTDLISRVNF